jgi:hypothetical protein
MVRKKYWIIRSDDHDDSDEHVYDRITISVAEKLLSMWVINTLDIVSISYNRMG